jgi:hypothetical protein
MRQPIAARTRTGRASSRGCVAPASDRALGPPEGGRRLYRGSRPTQSRFVLARPVLIGDAQPDRMQQPPIEGGRCKSSVAPSRGSLEAPPCGSTANCPVSADPSLPSLTL